MPEILEHDTETAALKVPPHSVEAEQSVLGGLMLDNQAWDNVADRLVADDFYRYEHRLIFNVMAQLAEAARPLDVVTLSEALEGRDQLDTVGGLAYLAELARNTPSASNIRAYADIVRERATLRKLIRAASQIADGAFSPQGRPADELVDEAERLVFQISEERPKSGGPIGMSELLAKAVDRIDELFNMKGEMTGLSTGFRDLDEMTSGLQPSDLVIIAGRPSMGKCIMAGSRLVDPASGALVTIDELVARQQADLLSLGDDFRLAPARASAFVDDGHKPVFRVRTALGREICTTLTHPFLTGDGWQPLERLAVGERVAVPRRLPVFGRERLPEHQVKVLAYMIADGGTTQTNALFTNADPRLRAEFDEAVAAFPGLVCRPVESAGRTPALRVSREPQALDGTRGLRQGASRGPGSGRDDWGGAGGCAQRQQGGGQWLVPGPGHARRGNLRAALPRTGGSAGRARSGRLRPGGEECQQPDAALPGGPWGMGDESHRKADTCRNLPTREAAAGTLPQPAFRL